MQFIHITLFLLTFWHKVIYRVTPKVFYQGTHYNNNNKFIYCHLFLHPAR